MKAYALLRDALYASGRVGLGTIVLRNKESLVVLKPYNDVIVLNKIRFQEEIRSTSGLNLPEVSEKKSKEMDMAIKLIDQLTERFDIEKYRDTYASKLLDVIKNKAKGKKQVAPKLKVVHKQDDDLMSMLKASLQDKKRKSS